ncbi:MAG: diguanylate cyclase domain-containing protein, partial [Acidimicrobiales bacterium]
MWTLNLGLAGGAAAVYFLLIGHLAAVTGLPVTIGWPVLAVLFAATQIGVIQLRTRSQAHIISVGDIPLVLGLIFATPTHLLAGQLAGAGLALVLHRRQGPTQIAFRLATLALQTTAALVVFHALVGTSAPISVNGWAGSLAAAGASTVIGSVAIFLSLALSGGSIVPTRIAQAFGLALAATFTATNLAIVTANGITAGPYLVAPLAVLAALLVVAYRALLAERGRRDGLEFLYRVSQITQSPGDFDQMFVELLEEARTMFSAEMAEIIMFGDDRAGDPQLVRTTVGLGSEPERMLSTESVLTRSAIEDASGPEARIVESGLNATGNSMVARLTGETRSHGVLVAANPPHISSGFKSGQLRLFQTLANHITLTLENGQLERSIVQLKEMEQELSYKAFHDPLTSLANRALFRTRLQEALDAEEPGLAVIFIDLDDFKTVNDTLGHATGDQLLTIVGARIDDCVAEGDLAARLGGDEFAVMAGGVGQTEAARMAAALMAALGRPIDVAGRQVLVQASLGVAMASGAKRSADDLMRHADLAMYTAKRNGKGSFE